MRQTLIWIRKNCVLLGSLLLAIASIIGIGTEGCWRAIDWPVLNLLFCLMAVVAGLKHYQLFAWLGQRLLRGCTHYRHLALRLVGLTFFSSMLITNDVALIAFVPFSIYLLDILHLRNRMVGLIVLQTVAANLGSMALPIGNPQNLFIFAYYHLSLPAFLMAVVPSVILGFLVLMGLVFCLRDETFELPAHTEATLTSPWRVGLLGILFALCLCTVFRWFPQIGLLLSVLGTLLLIHPRILRHVDYGLLGTFICFFIFSNNIGHLASVREMLIGALAKAPTMTAWAVSQVASNVPSALLLAPFTTDWQPLLLGVDWGGLGTPVASLASLISLSLYLREPAARPWRYLCYFTLLNMGVLLVLVGVSYLLN